MTLEGLCARPGAPQSDVRAERLAGIRMGMKGEPQLHPGEVWSGFGDYATGEDGREWRWIGSRWVPFPLRARDLTISGREWWVLLTFILIVGGCVTGIVRSQCAAPGMSQTIPCGGTQTHPEVQVPVCDKHGCR